MEVRRVFFARVERVDNFSRSIHVDDKTLVPLDDRQICGFDTIAETVNGNFRLRPLDRPTRKYLYATRPSPAGNRASTICKSSSAQISFAKARQALENRQSFSIFIASHSKTLKIISGHFGTLKPKLFLSLPYVRPERGFTQNRWWHNRLIPLPSAAAITQGIYKICGSRLIQPVDETPCQRGDRMRRREFIALVG